MKKEIKNFLHYLELGNKSDRTIKLYASALTYFSKKMKVKSPSEITYPVVSVYQSYLNRKSYTPSTIALHLNIIRSFLRFLLKNDYIVLNPEKIELPKINRNLNSKILTPEQLNRLLELSKADIMHHALIMLLISTGVRVSELCSLNKDSFSDLKTLVVNGKGDKTRPCFLTESARESLTKYLDSRQDKTEYLFCMPEGNGSIHPRHIQRILQRYGKIIGVRIYPHLLRHQFACNLLKNGADIRAIQQMLGHATITTTTIYASYVDTQLKEIHNKFSLVT